MTTLDEAQVALKRAAIEWCAGGRGQLLVAAAADALAAGLDSPSLRVLAGATRLTADEEANELADDVFRELGIAVHDRFSTPAVVDAARLAAEDFLRAGGPPRALAATMYQSFLAAGYPDDLADWSGLDDWYDMLDAGLIEGRVEDVDVAVWAAAAALTNGERLARPPSAFARADANRRRRKLWRSRRHR